MRIKIDIQKYDDERILFFGSKGLTDDYINAVNELAMREGWSDVAFGEMEADGRIALVCKPVTGAKILEWDSKRNKKHYPPELIKSFLKKANQALHEDDLQLYMEELTRNEDEIKKYVLEEALKSREKRDGSQDEEKDETWEDDKP